MGVIDEVLGNILKLAITTEGRKIREKRDNKKMFLHCLCTDNAYVLPPEVFTSFCVSTYSRARVCRGGGGAPPFYKLINF